MAAQVVGFGLDWDDWGLEKGDEAFLKAAESLNMNAQKFAMTFLNKCV